MGKGVFDFLAPIAGAALGSIIPGVGTAIGASIGSGLNSGIKTGNPLSGALAAGGSYLGGKVLGGLEGTLGQTPANALGGAIGGSSVASFAPLGSFAGNILGSQTIGSLAGQATGGQLGESLGNQLNPKSPDLGSSISTPGFTPTRSPQMGLPQSLSQLSGLDPLQQGSNIASKGVYGGGVGPEETNYFLNLVNRNLVSDNGQVASDTSSINPVENSFLSQIGLGGFNNPTDLLKGISQYKTV